MVDDEQNLINKSVNVSVSLMLANIDFVVKYINQAFILPQPQPDGGHSNFNSNHSESESFFLQHDFCKELDLEVCRREKGKERCSLQFQHLHLRLDC